MSLAELQLKLHQTIDTITDKKKLNAIYSLLKSSNETFSPISLEDYVKAIDDARDQIKSGNVTSVEDLEKESNNW